MTGQMTSLFLLILLAATIPATLGFYALRRRTGPGITEFGWLMMMVTWWVFTSVLENIVPTIPMRVLWAKFQYIGITSTPVFWFLFTTRFTRRDTILVRDVLLGLWIIPVITVIVAFSNDLHHLLWTDIIPATGDPESLLVYIHGPWFWVQVCYSYILYIAGTMILYTSITQLPKVYRSQASALILASLIPILSNVLYITNLTPVRGLDLTPMSFIVSGIIAAWSIFHFRIFDLAPVARDAVIDNMWDGVLVLDTRDYVADINPRARQMLGISDVDCIGTPVKSLLSDWSELSSLLDFKDDFRSREIQSNRSPSLTVDVSLTRLKDWRGKTIGRLVVLRDATDRKQAESLQDTLVHMIVHDLRNPLNNIIASLDLMNISSQREGEEYSSKRQILQETAQASANRMITLVNSILDINRLESGQMELNLQLIDLQPILSEVIHMQLPLANLTNISMNELIQPELPRILADENLIRRVLQNILDNSMRYAPPNSSIDIGAQTVSGESFIRFYIHDQGPGISMDQQERLFDKFITGARQCGSGLGLNFCKLVVEAHGGKIWAESSSETGTTLYFTLPTH